MIDHGTDHALSFQLPGSHCLEYPDGSWDVGDIVDLEEGRFIIRRQSLPWARGPGDEASVFGYAVNLVKDLVGRAWLTRAKAFRGKAKACGCPAPHVSHA